MTPPRRPLAALLAFALVATVLVMKPSPVLAQTGPTWAPAALIGPDDQAVTLHVDNGGTHSGTSAKSFSNPFFGTDGAKSKTVEFVYRLPEGQSPACIAQPGEGQSCNIFYYDDHPTNEPAWTGFGLWWPPEYFSANTPQPGSSAKLMVGQWTSYGWRHGGEKHYIHGSEIHIHKAHLISITHHSNGWTELFVNGVLVNQWQAIGSTTLTQFATAWLYGHPDGASAGMKGQLEHVRFADGALTGADLDRRKAVFPSGEDVAQPVEPAKPPIPQLACGRTMRNMGGGQWYADVEVIVRNPAVAPTKDTFGTWRPSWDGSSFAGRRQTIPLPAGAKIGDGLEATHTMRRDYEAGTKWKLPTAQEGDFTDASSDYLTPDDVVGGPALGGPLLMAVINAAEWIASEVGAEGSGSITAVDGAGAPLPRVPTTETVVASVYGRCTINIDPVAEEDEGKTEWVVINITNNPDDPSAPPADSTSCGEGTTYDAATQTCKATGGAPSEQCNDSPFWKFWDWPDKVVCLLGGIFDLIKDVWGLLQRILDWIAGKLPLPDVGAFFGEWETKFPLSLIAEAGDAFGVLEDALQQGLDSGSSTTVSASAATTSDAGTSTTTGSCGPSIDPDLDSRITLPGDSSGAALNRLQVSLPVPVECPGQSADAQRLADLMGMRRPVRGFLTIALFAAFLVKAASSFGPKRNGLEPDGIEKPDAYMGRWQR